MTLRKILIEAYCPTIDDVNELETRFNENYCHFFNEYENEEYNYDEATKMVHFVWGGAASEDFTEDDMDYLIRTTHHAEDLYEDSNIEHTHVEVCVDGKWYGRCLDKVLSNATERSVESDGAGVGFDEPEMA